MSEIEKLERERVQAREREREYEQVREQEIDKLDARIKFYNEIERDKLDILLEARLQARVEYGVEAKIKADKKLMELLYIILINAVISLGIIAYLLFW